MSWGKKILILDLMIFFLSFMFVFILGRTIYILKFALWFVSLTISIIHEVGHGFVCAVGGGFPMISFAILEGNFAFTAPCISFGAFNPFVRSIETIYGLVFNCILIFLLFYFAAASNKKNFNHLIFSFFISSYGWIAVDHLQSDIYKDYFLQVEDIPRVASFFGIPISIIVTYIAALMILLILIALRYGLEEEQKSGKINVANLEILPLEIEYADLFRMLFFLLLNFLGVTLLVQFIQPNIVGMIIAAIIVAFLVYFHTVYSVGNKFRQIMANITINIKEIITSFNFLSAAFQCKTEKNVVFSIAYSREGWIVEVPSKKISFDLPNYVTAEDVAEKIENMFSYHNLR